MKRISQLEKHDQWADGVELSVCRGGYAKIITQEVVHLSRAIRGRSWTKVVMSTKLIKEESHSSYYCTI